MKKFFAVLLSGLLSFSFMSCDLLGGAIFSPDQIDEDSVQVESFMDGVLFTWPAVKYAKYYFVQYNDKVIKVTSPSFWAAYDPDTETYPYYQSSVKICVKAGNDAGESYSSFLSGYTIGLSPYNDQDDPFSYEIVDFTETTATIKFSGVKVRNNTSYVYEIYDSSYADTLICSGEKNSDTITLTDLTPAKTFSYGFKCRLTVDVNGVEKSFKQLYPQDLKFETKMFSAAPTNVKVDSVGRTKVVISYDPLTSEQLGDIDASKIVYTVYYTAKDGSSGYTTGNDGSSDPISVTRLNPETEYSFIVRAGYQYANDKNAASEAVTVTTLEALKAPENLVLTETEGTNSYSSGINIKFDKATEDDKIMYYAEYKVLKSSDFSNSDKETFAPAVYDEDGININVNKGNRYIVRVGAYVPEESYNVMYSDEKEIQLTKMNTNGLTGEPIFQGLYNTTSGNLRSTSISGPRAIIDYVFDIPPGTYFLDSKNGGTISYDVTAALDSSNKLVMYYLNSNSGLNSYSGSTVTLGGTKYSMADVKENYLIAPCLEKKPVLYKLNYMKRQDTSGGWESPEKLADYYKNTIYDYTIFNNCIYVYIKYYNFSDESEYVGFGFSY